jgi:hypothetical protein
LGQFRKSFQLDEGLRALSVAFVEVAREGNDTVDLLGTELFLIFDQAHSSLHGTGVLLLVHLTLAEKEEMDGFSALPGVSKSFISRGTNVGGDQRIHGLSRNVSSSIACLSNLSHLGIKHSLLVRVNLKGSEHVDLLDQQEGSVLLSHFQGDFSQKSSGICILVSLSIQFNSLDLLVLLD